MSDVGIHPSWFVCRVGALRTGANIAALGRLCVKEVALMAAATIRLDLDAQAKLTQDLEALKKGLVKLRGYSSAVSSSASR